MQKVPVYLFFASLFIPALCYAQNPLTQKVTININNMTLTQIIKILEQEYQVTFSYDSQIIPKKTIFNSKVQHTTIEQLLKAILPEASLNYKLINNHIALYYFKYPEPEELKSEAKPVPESDLMKEIPEEAIISQGQKVVPEGDKVTIYDTVVYTINDTIFEVVYDTFQISIVDTVVYYDTVSIIIERERKRSWVGDLKEPKYLIGIQSGMFIPGTQKDVFLFRIPNAELIDNKSTWNYVPTASLGFSFEDYYGNICVRAGMLATSLRQSIDFSYISSTQVPNTEISDSYFLVGNDTNWLDVIEDEFIYQVDTVSMAHAVQNRYYIQIPLELGYKYYLNTKLSLGFYGGVQGNLLVTERTNYPTVLKPHESIRPKSTFLSVNAGLQAEYELTETIHLGLMARYTHGIGYKYAYPSVNLSVSKPFY